MDDDVSESSALSRDYRNDSMMDEDEQAPSTRAPVESNPELDQLKGFFAKLRSHSRGKTKIQFVENKDVGELLTMWQDDYEDTKQQEIYRRYTEQYKEWHSLLSNKFHLAFYGVGSSKKLLEHFCMTEISPTRPLVILNGFYPGLTLKDVLKAIVTKVAQAQYDSEEIRGSPEYVLSCLEVFFSRPDRSLVLLIHCVDELIRLNMAIWEAICNRLARGRANVHLIISVDSHFSATAIPPHLPFVWYPVVTGAPYSQEMVFRAHASATSASSLAKGLPKLDEEAALHALSTLQARAVLIFCFFANLIISRKKPISIELLLEKVSTAEPDVNFKVLETFLNQLQSHRLLKRSLKSQTIEPSLDMNVMQKAIDEHEDAWILHSDELL